MYHSSLENPRIWLYTEKLDRIMEEVRVQLADVQIKVKLYEFENAVQLEDTNQSSFPEAKLNTEELARTNQNLAIVTSSNKHNEKKLDTSSPQSNSEQHVAKEKKALEKDQSCANRN